MIGVGIEGIRQAIKEKGLRIPEDISEVDFGSTECNHVFYDVEESGRLSFERLYYRLTNPGWKPERILVPYKLYIRDSTRKLI